MGRTCVHQKWETLLQNADQLSIKGDADASHRWKMRDWRLLPPGRLMFDAPSVGSGWLINMPMTWPPSADPPSDLHQVTCSWRAYAKLMSPKNAISARSSCCDSVKEWHRLR